MELTKIYALAAGAALLALILGSLLFVFMAKPAIGDCGGSRMGSGDVGGPFNLVDGSGLPVSESDVITKPALVYFGYTYCPDVCPFDIARNAVAVDILAEQGIDAVPVFISVDPERDTAEVVAEYAEAHHPKLIGLTGTVEQVKAAADAYRVYFKKQETGDADYLVDHTSFTYLMLPKSGFADFFRRDTSAGEIAERVSCRVNSG